MIAYVETNPTQRNHTHTSNPTRTHLDGLVVHGLRAARRRVEVVKRVGRRQVRSVRVMRHRPGGRARRRAAALLLDHQSPLRDLRWEDLLVDRALVPAHI